jgi:hypothetical protein
LEKEKEYRELLLKRGMSNEKVDVSVASVKRAIEYFDGRGVALNEASVNDFRGYVATLMALGKNSYDDLVPVARYVNLLGMKDVYVYYASILGGAPIFPSIRKRLGEFAGEETCNRVFSHVDQPPLGSDPGAYPPATRQLMEQLERELPRDVYRRVLAGNHHGVPVEAFMEQKRWLEEMGNIDSWLARVHHAAVAELDKHRRENKIWYEQIITQGVVDLVRDDPELLSGLRVGDWIYTKKFPYSPQAYIDEKEPEMRKYYMCHCPLAREAILSGEPGIPADWCYCSAGYDKFRYDIAFGEDTEVEVLENVFSGSDGCRFRVKIPKRWR